MRDALPQAGRPAPVIRVRIIGIGSWSGDDRIGWDAIEAIEASGVLRRFPPDSVDAVRCDRPGGLLALAAGAPALILIDAMRSGASPGTVRRLAAEEVAMAQGGMSSHGLGVAEWLAVARALDLLPAAVLVYGIEAPSSAPATEPGERVSAAVPAVLRLLSADLAALAHADRGPP